MKFWTLFLSGLLILVMPGQAQLLQVKLGMSKQQLLLHAHPRQANEGFFLVRERGQTFVYRQDTDPNYETEITFTLRGDKVSTIQAVHIGKNEEFRRVMQEYYRESITDMHNRPDFEANQGLAASTQKRFQTYRPQVQAFTDPNMTRMLVFMCYHQDGKVLFTRLERLF